MADNTETTAAVETVGDAMKKEELQDGKKELTQEEAIAIFNERYELVKSKKAKVAVVGKLTVIVEVNGQAIVKTVMRDDDGVEKTVEAFAIRASRTSGNLYLAKLKDPSEGDVPERTFDPAKL